MIIHWPIAKENNKARENSKLFEIVAKAIILTKIGDEQGLAASAKNIPTKKGSINKLPDLFCGIFFTIVGKCKSKTPKRFNPNIIIKDAKSNITIGDAILAKTLPDIAQKTPMILRTLDKPKENDIIWISNFLLFSLEYPAIYAIINGRIPKLQGDKEESIPAKNAIIINNGIKTVFSLESIVKYWRILFIDYVLNFLY